VRLRHEQQFHQAVSALKALLDGMDRDESSLYILDDVEKRLKLLLDYLERSLKADKIVVEVTREWIINIPFVFFSMGYRKKLAPTEITGWRADLLDGHYEKPFKFRLIPFVWQITWTVKPIASSMILGSFMQRLDEDVAFLRCKIKEVVLSAPSISELRMPSEPTVLEGGIEHEALALEAPQRTTSVDPGLPSLDGLMDTSENKETT